MQFSSRRSYAIRGFLVFVATTVAGLATAQTVLDEEIVVTARKIEENPQDIPIAVSAFSQESIQELNINNTDEIALFTPGLSFNSAFGRQPGSDRASIRGVTTILNGPANTGSVATFVDGVYFGGTTQTTELFNLERVEILRGPQAAQFGRGTYAGAINYITRGPSEVWEGDITATAAEDDEYRLNSWISGPIAGDKLGFYAGVGYYTFDGQYTNRKIGDTALTQGRELGDDVGGEETKSISGKLFWNPTDKLSITAKLGYEETDDDHFPIYLQTRFFQARNTNPADPATGVLQNNCCFRTAASPRAREYYSGTAQKTSPVQLNTDILDQADLSGIEIDRKIFALTVDYDVEGFGFLDGATLSSLTGYVDDEINQGLDTTYGGYEFFPEPFLGFLRGTFNQIDDDSQEDLSQEFRITSSRDNPFRWSLGLYYYRGEEQENRDERAFADPATGVVTKANQNNASLTRNRVEDKAIFGSLEYDVLDNLTGTVELRYSSDEVKTRAKFQDDRTIDFRGQDSEQNWLPRFTVTWGVTDDINLYGNVSKGIKPQAINSAIPLTPAGDLDTSKRFVDQEEAWNYEIGLKSLWWDGRALFNVSGYFFDIDDQQLTQNLIDPNTGVANSFLDTVGETEIWGAEVEGSILLFEYLTLGFNYAYADSEIKEYINQDQADLLGSDGSDAQNQLLGDVSGNQSPRVPEHMASFTSRYERPFGRDGSWFASINYAWEDSRYAQVHNLIETGQRSDLRASIGGSWGPWSLSIWGKNLTEDESAIDIIRYVDRTTGSLPSCPSLDPNAVCTAQSPSNTPRGFGVTLPRERQFGATMTFRFGGE